MKFFSLISKVMLVILLPLFFLTFSITIAFNSQGLYQYGFNKYDIEQVTGIEKTELKQASFELINYFNSGDELIHVMVQKNGQPFELFNKREALHLRDVKVLVELNYKVLILCGIYISGFCAVFLVARPAYWHKFLHNLIAGSLLTLFLIATVGIIALMDFNWFFLQFHLLSFTNDLWLLDPAKDYLIMMFPQGFWFDATFFVTGMAIGGALLTIAVSWILGRQRKVVL